MPRHRSNDLRRHRRWDGNRHHWDGNRRRLEPLCAGLTVRTGPNARLAAPVYRCEEPGSHAAVPAESTVAPERLNSYRLRYPLLYTVVRLQLFRRDGLNPGSRQ